jgi:hypothetical protein
MALEINEIAIQMQVASGSDEPPETEASAEEGGSGDEKVDYEKIVEECVRRVLQAMKQMKER